MDITPIVEAFFIFVFAAIMYFFVPLMKERMSAEQFETIRLWVTVAVKAAEQLYQGSKRGPEKKRYVKEFLKSKGLKIDMESLDALIESAVHDNLKDTN